MAKADPNVVHKHILAASDGLNIIIVGVGGTGGYVARDALQIIGGKREDIQKRISLTAVDGDTFEAKNLGRQLCIPEDLGKNKAEIITKRYTSAYDISKANISFIPEYLTRQEQFQDLLGAAVTNIVVDCLDKTRPRLLLHKGLEIAASRRRNFQGYLISSGNSAFEGQVSWGAVVKNNNNFIRHSDTKGFESDPYPFSVPLPYKRMPRLMDPKVDDAEDAMSCADRAAQNVQTVTANITAATITSNFLAAMIRIHEDGLLARPTIPLTCGELYFDSSRNNFNPKLLTTEFMKGELF